MDLRLITFLVGPVFYSRTGGVLSLGDSVQGGRAFEAPISSGSKT